MKYFSKNLLVLITSVIFVFIVLYIIFLNTKEGFSTIQNIDQIKKETNDIINQLEKTTYKTSDMVKKEAKDILNQLEKITYKTSDMVKKETKNIINKLEKITYKSGDSIKKETNDILNQLEKTIYKTSDMVEKETNYIIEQLRNITYKTSDMVKKETKDIINKLERITYKSGDSIKEETNDIINQLEKTTYKTSDMVKEETNNIINQLEKITYNSSNLIQKETNDILNQLYNVTYKSSDLIKEETNDVINQLYNITYKSAESIKKETNDVINQLEKITNKTSDMVKKETNDVINQLEKTTNKTSDSIKKETNDVINQLEKTTNKTSDSIKKETNDVINQLEKTTNETSDSTKKETTSIFNDIKDWFYKYFINPISSVFKTISNNSLFYVILVIIFVFSLLYIIIRFTLLKATNVQQDVFNKSSFDGDNFSLYKKSLLTLFELTISGLIIFIISYKIEQHFGNTSIVTFLLIFALIAIFLGLIYKTVNVKFPSNNSNKNAFFNLTSTTLLYIPCILSGIFDWFGKMAVGQYNATDAGSFMMLFVALGLVVAYFKTPSLFNYISTQGGKQLVNKPVYTGSEYNLGSYLDLNGSDTFDYQYAISFWVFIDAAPPNMNPNYNKFTSLLNFGNKPNVMYNGSKNTLMITMQQKDLKNVTKNILIDFDDEDNRIIYINKNILLQKWNNVIINYNGGTMDIFLNGELVKSSNEVVPYYTYDNLTIGENGGIKGGISNVVYFRRALTSSNIYYLYNSVKNRTLPILNDSDETLMVKNINTVINSVKTLT